MEILYCFKCGGRVKDKKIEHTNRKVWTVCATVLYENPRPVTAVIVLKKNQVLLVKRKIEPGKGKWCLPCGFIELFEKPMDGAYRELKEETNIKAENLRIADVIYEDNPIYKSVTIIVYITEQFKGKPRAGDDAEAVEFFGINELPDIAFQSHLRVIQKFLDNKHTYRVIDAAFNRTIEGLRVVEDFLRFTPDIDTNKNKSSRIIKKEITELKKIRQELSKTIMKLDYKNLLKNRDIINDPGKEKVTDREYQRNRESLPVANCSRIKEGLRSLEEHTKIINTETAEKIKGLRYRFYDVERRILLTV